MSSFPTTDDEFAAIDDEDGATGEDVVNLDLCHWDYLTRKYDRGDFFVDGTNTNVPSVDPTRDNSTGGNVMNLPQPSTHHAVSLGSKHTSAGVAAPTGVDVNPSVVYDRAASGQTFTKERPRQPPPTTSDRINKAYASIYQIVPQHPANDDKSLPRCSARKIKSGIPAFANMNTNAQKKELKLILDEACDSSSEYRRPSLQVPMALLQLANPIHVPPPEKTETTLAIAQPPMSACHPPSILDQNNTNDCYHVCEHKQKQLETLLDAACDSPTGQKSRTETTALDWGDRPLLHSPTAAKNVPTTLEALFSYSQHTKTVAVCKPMATYNYFFRDERDNILRGITKPTDPLPSPVNDFSEKKKEALLHHRWNVEPTLGRRKHRKTHGKINFTMLTKEISSRWRNLPESGRAFYREVAKADKDHYDRILGS